MIKLTLRIIIVLSIASSSTMCQKEKDYKEYHELHKHPGSKNYEINTVFDKDYEVTNIYLDTVSKQLNVGGHTNPIDKDKTEGGRKKISHLGETMDDGPGYDILRDGSMMYYSTYNNWAIDGDKSEHSFQDPLSEEEKQNPEKRLEKFKDFYENSSYVYLDMSDYYFKRNDIWYKIKSYQMADALNLDIKKLYPAKEDQEVRFLELRDLRSGKMENDTTLARLVGYEETDSEDGGFFNPISFSAGYYFMELYMPLGDTIKIKRHGSMGTAMQFYKMPVAYGGRNDVIFIVQEPNPMYPDREFGGMFAVGPRNPKQDQYGIYKSEADNYPLQDSTSTGRKELEEKFVKPMIP